MKKLSKSYKKLQWEASPFMCDKEKYNEDKIKEKLYSHSNKLFNLINTFGKEVGYKIKIQRSVVFSI
jgi:hypothetical protein